jgi:hypothetical protein
MFKKGNKYGKGRPKGSKNLLPAIRDITLQTLYKRRKELERIGIDHLLRFAQGVMPKEVKNTGDTSVTYISTIPRQDKGVEDSQLSVDGKHTTTDIKHNKCDIAQNGNVKDNEELEYNNNKANRLKDEWEDID